MNELRENYETQAMQEALDRDSAYIAWSKAQESTIEEKDNSLDDLIRESEGMNNGSD